MRLLEKIAHTRKGLADILDTVLRIILAVLVCTILLALSYLGIDHYINSNYPPGEYPGWLEWWSGDLLKHREESLSIMDALRYAFDFASGIVIAVVVTFGLLGLYEAVRNARR
jgi:hypothetical protein